MATETSLPFAVDVYVAPVGTEPPERPRDVPTPIWAHLGKCEAEALAVTSDVDGFDLAATFYPMSSTPEALRCIEGVTFSALVGGLDEDGMFWRWHFPNMLTSQPERHPYGFLTVRMVPFITEPDALRYTLVMQAAECGDEFGRYGITCSKGRGHAGDHWGKTDGETAARWYTGADA